MANEEHLARLTARGGGLESVAERILLSPQAAMCLSIPAGMGDSRPCWTSRAADYQGYRREDRYTAARHAMAGYSVPTLEALSGHRGGHRAGHHLEDPAVASRRMARSDGAERPSEAAERCPDYSRPGPWGSSPADRAVFHAQEPPAHPGQANHRALYPRGRATRERSALRYVLGRSMHWSGLPGTRSGITGRLWRS